VTFEEFAAARLPALVRFAVVLTGDRGLAEDVVQEVLIRANGRWPQIECLERRAILAELARLPRRQRAVLVLRYYEGLSDQEIAEVLACGPGTVRSYASRALASLRVQLARPSHPVPAVIEEER